MQKVMLIVAVVVVVAVGVGLYFARGWNDRQPIPAPTAAPTATAVVPVEGMSCAACAASVRKTVASIDGVTAVEVDLEHRQAKVRYVPEKTSPQQIAGAITKLGYKAGEPTIEAAK